LLSLPQAVAVGHDGSVYIADYGNDEVRKVTPDGKITLIAGTGVPCETAPRCGDGHSALNAELTAPAGIAVNGKGDVFIADTGDNEIRMVTPKGIITRVAGTGSSCAKPPACGDGGPATSAQLTSPSGLALDRHGNLYIADTGDQEIRRVSTTGQIGRVAGSGAACSTPSSCGNGGSPTSARFNFPEGVAVGATGIYIADGGDQQVRKVFKGAITLVAGTGALCSSPPSCGDGGPATKARFNFPDSVAVGASGNVIIADAGDNEIRVVSSGGTITRVAGNGSACTSPPGCGDNGTGSGARLDYPNGVAVDGRGNIYIADSADNEVRFLSRAPVAHISAHGGSVALAEFAAAVRPSAVIIRFVTGAKGSVSLSVSGPSNHAVVAHGQPVGGLGRITWNRKLSGHPAPAGRYKLTLTETIGGHSGSVVFHVHI
jgi:sugar lactone lactonase YvrE